MSANPSPVSICSAALNKLGADGITSLTDGSPRAVHCNRLWPVVRDFVLAARNWGCTFERATLSKDASTPTYEYGAQYKLPGNLFLLLGTDLPEDTLYTVEQGFLLTSVDSGVSILYIKRTDDTTTYGPLLEAAMIAAMATELALPITGNKAVRDAMKDERDEKLGIASQRDSSQRPQQAFENRILIRVRR